MTNPHGTPIWYELVTSDPDGAARFYAAVAGWTVDPPSPAPAVDYRMISGPAGPLGGVLKLDEQMKAGGAQPGWLLYVGSDDVDRTVETAKGLGAHVLVPATDIAGIGRFSLLADPQGAPFYVMRGASPQASVVFGRGQLGRCGWNELVTSDVKAALAFYGELFGWENRETMDMGPMGGYHFLDLGDTRIGAMVQMADMPAHWSAYFVIADVDAAAKAVPEHGGVLHMGPIDVPGGERILKGADPQGAEFSLVTPAKG